VTVNDLPQGWGVTRARKYAKGYGPHWNDVVLDRFELKCKLHNETIRELIREHRKEA
jgi:hypothetical protein